MGRQSKDSPTTVRSPRESGGEWRILDHSLSAIAEVDAVNKKSKPELR